MRRSIFTAAVVLPLAAVTLSGCNQSQSNAQQAKRPPPAVTVATPLQRAVASEEERVGRFTAAESVEIRARVAGTLEAIHFTDGQIVKKGDPLFTIDQRPFKIALEQAQSRLAVSKASLQLAKADLSRARELIMGTSVTRQAMDQRVAAMATAEANVRLQIAVLHQAELDMEFTEPKAPISGRIGDRRVSVGNFITAANSANSSTLATIESIDPIRLEFTLDESAYLRLLRASKSVGAIVGRPVKLRLIDEASFSQSGKLDFIDNAISRSSGTIRARAEIANPKGLFTPGMFARVRIEVAEPKMALLVPDTAIGSEQARKLVMVVGSDNIPKPRYVKIGKVVDGLRVIQDGLKTDDKVVINGLMRIRPGAPVTPQLGAIKAQLASNTPDSN
ncbi:MAG: efflux RND transporter periplasmic adaptor subunit [Hyphomicrobiaceae bacterium]